MSKLIRLISSILLVAFSLLYLACEKEEARPTVIKGKVTDRKTGAPVAGAYIQCSSTTGSPPNEVSTDRSASTDFAGNYVIVIPSDERGSFANVYEPGYLPKVDPSEGNFTQNGDTIIVNVQLIPTDGFLRLILKNDMVEHDSIYVKIFSPIMSSEGLGVKGPKYPLVLSTDGVHEEIFAFPSEEQVDIYWDFKKFITPDALFKSSIFLPANDTTTFEISY